jgi:hypothetical protein
MNEFDESKKQDLKVVLKHNFKIPAPKKQRGAILTCSS